MKKYGKYEKRAEQAPVKQPESKSLLLQTYFTSLLCLVLCVSMFLGTSYAWFTSEVNNTANEIYVGTLKVGLYKEIEETTEGGERKKVDVSLADSNTKLFDKNIRWEPGYTALETIKVVNEGDLAFKYELRFTDGSLAEESKMKLAEVAKHFDVWVYSYRGNKDAAPTAASYADITQKDSGWENAGSLDALLAGEVVLEDVMITVRNDSEANANANKGTTDGVATPDTYTIALHMKEDADSSVMGQKISLNVKLIAYQLNSELEKDGFGNSNYDANVTVASDAASLQNVLKSSGSSVQLITDVAIDNLDDRAAMAGGTLYGNGKKVTYSGGRDGEASVGVLTTTGGTIQNLTIEGGADGRALYITSLTSDLSVSDCVLSGAYAFNLNSAAETEHTLTFANTTFKSWTSYANVAKQVNFTDCAFEDVLKPYGDTTLENCTFTKEGLDVSELKTDETITLTNCTYNGKLIEKAVVTNGTDGIGITESTLLEIKDNLVVLKANG